LTGPYVCRKLVFPAVWVFEGQGNREAVILEKLSARGSSRRETELVERPLFLLLSAVLLFLCSSTACSHSSPHAMDGGAAGSGGQNRDAAADAVDMRAADGKADATAVVCTTTGKHSSAAGETCQCDSDCTTGICADGVCCTTACSGKCTSCNLPGSEGVCSMVPPGGKPRQSMECPAQDATSCGRDGTCDGEGGCRLYVAGASCRQGICDSGSISGRNVCDGNGACKPGPAVVCWPYGCADGKCLSTCATDAECAPGLKCAGNACGKLPNGRGPCKGADDCLSGFCADGVCCNTACDGMCVSCDQTGSEGQCRPVGRGLPHDKCMAQERSTCGTTGVCDGFGSCAVYDADTTCISPTCSGSSANSPGTCDGNGTCQAPGQVDCSPFMCSGTVCSTMCTTDADCVAPNTCVNGSCGKKPMGASCKAAGECLSNFCVDGFCCESACDGACRTCGSSGSPGRCLDVAAGRDDPHHQCKDTGAASCGTDGTCDGSGACRQYGTDTMCAPETCTAGSYTAASTCSEGGQCLPPPSRTCYPFACNGSHCFDVCTQNSQCVSPNTCVNGSCGLKPPGASCSSASECQQAPDGKAYCAQGVCCNSSCSGACQACNLSSSPGRCSAVANGTADKQCATKNVSTCGTNGTCRNGACDVYHTSNQCAAPSCSSATSSLAPAFCDGKGDACPSQTTVSCGAFTCDSTTGLCRTSCDTDSQCVSPNSCTNHSCGKKGNQATCTSGAQCESGNCVEGVCCNTSCSAASGGVCQSCKVANHVGTCTPVPAGGADPGGRCLASDRTSCGLDGVCDGTGKCEYWNTSTSCRNQSCPAGSTQTNAATCDGKGACMPATTKNCSPYACNVNQATCRTTCTSNGDCASGVPCNTQTNKCGDKLAPGAVCGADTDCSQSHCVKTLAADATGICCDTACSGGCQSCALSGKAGTCTNIATGSAPRDPAANTCPTSTNTCGNTGMCDGKGACQLPADGTSCSDGNMCTQLDTCKAGACVGASPVTCKASDACHVAGTCNTTTGACTNPTAADGTTCSDGSACTTGDACKAGVCTPTTTKTCAASDQCHTAGTCDSTTGMCSNPAKAEGAACSDGNACTTGDSCKAGVCTGGATMACTASDSCHSVGTCDPATGMCSNPAKAEGATCNDGNACTTGDSCKAGVCTGTTIACTASDSCHSAGTCDPATGMCSDPAKPDGTTCDDGKMCTTGETCKKGMCTGGMNQACPASDQCHTGGTCDPTTGMCSNPAKADGAKCDDGNACTTGNDTCVAGVCTGGPAVTCAASDMCHTAGTCDPATGMCSNPAKADGAKCDDGKACTTDACRAGVCVSTVSCPADECHQAGTCDANGRCTNPAVLDGTTCSTGICCTGACTNAMTCAGGTPTGGTAGAMTGQMNGRTPGPTQ